MVWDRNYAELIRAYGVHNRAQRAHSHKRARHREARRKVEISSIERLNAAVERHHALTKAEIARKRLAAA